MTLIKPIIAGMPALLPWDSEPSPLISEPFSRQVQLLLGSVIVLCLGAMIIRWLWNSLAEDFESLPKMSYLRSLGMTVLWSLAMIVVLILIDGTRHTLSPSAWVRNGWTYRLSTEQEQLLVASRKNRRENLERLYRDFKKYRDESNGTLPTELAVINSLFAEVPDAGGLNYLYEPEVKNSTFRIFEPRLLDDIRYTVNENGEVSEWQ